MSCRFEEVGDRNSGVGTTDRAISAITNCPSYPPSCYFKKLKGGCVSAVS